MLGEKIKELRQKKGLSGFELARRAGRPTSSIHNIETGATKYPRFDVMCDISNALGVSLDSLKEYVK